MVGFCWKQLPAVKKKLCYFVLLQSFWNIFSHLQSALTSQACSVTHPWFFQLLYRLNKPDLRYQLESFTGAGRLIVHLQTEPGQLFTVVQSLCQAKLTAYSLQADIHHTDSHIHPIIQLLARQQMRYHLACCISFNQVRNK